jgi:hypothetical protein
MRGMLTVLLAAMLAGCVSSAGIESVFDRSAAAIVLESGNRTIKGQALLGRENGTIEYAGNNKVRLLPDTPYQRWRMKELYGERRIAYTAKEIKDTPPDYAKYSRETIADADGRFTFTQVPEGKYFVATKVFWKEGENLRGGYVYAPVDLTEADQLALVVNGK